MNQEIVVEIKRNNNWEVVTASCGYNKITKQYSPQAVRPQIRIQMLNSFGISSQLMLYIANPAVDFARGILGNEFRISIGYSGIKNGVWTNTIAPIFIGQALDNGTQVISNGTDQILQLSFSYQATTQLKYTNSDNTSVKIDDFLKSSFPDYQIIYTDQGISMMFIQKNITWSKTSPTWQQLVQHFLKQEGLKLMLVEKNKQIVVASAKVNSLAPNINTLTGIIFNNENETCIKNPYTIIGYGGIMLLELAFVMPNLINKCYAKIENPNTNFYMYDTTDASADISSTNLFQINSQEIIFDTFTGESVHNLKLQKIQQ